MCEDVGDGCRENEEAFWELEGDALCAEGADAVDCFVDFEGVVFWEEGDCGVDVGVVENFGGDLV